jgi:2-isopropylmalate synthase/UPF0716 protein FxsA
MVSSYFISEIGGLNTFLEILFSAFIGIYILSSFKYSLQDNINKIRTGQITQEEFVKTNAGKSIGALLLIVPGFFTDIFGLLLQFSLFINLISKIFSVKTHNTQFHNHYTQNDYTHKNNTKELHDEIIDVEIIDDNNATK